MGRKHAAPPPAAQTYRSSPLLMKPGKRSRQEALPSALHMGICVTLSLLVFAIINICVTESLGPKNPWTKLVQSGTMVRQRSCAFADMPSSKARSKVLQGGAAPWHGHCQRHQSVFVNSIKYSHPPFATALASVMADGHDYCHSAGHTQPG